jgi:hypothetical protein
MTARAAFVLGLFAMAAAVLHGGIWSAGHDFVVNRFTGEFVFVPGDQPNGEEARLRARARVLTMSEADDRVAASLPRR